jgi:hypothetical protein
MQPVSPETTCMFLAEGTRQEQEDELGIAGMGMGAWPAAGVGEDVATPLIFRGAEQVDVIKFWPWVNQVRVCLVPCLGTIFRGPLARHR